jgi:hypothetical protein
MSNFPLPLNANETVLKSDEKAAHVKDNLIGYNVIYGTLWLTSQRVIFQPALFGSALAYPLSHIGKAVRAEVSLSRRTSQYSSQSYDAALYVEFDNGGKLYFIPEDIQAWASALLEAKALAPNLPFTQMPPRRSAVEEGKRGLWIILGVMGAIILLFICMAITCFGLPLLLSMFSSSGG